MQGLKLFNFLTSYVARTALALCAVTTLAAYANAATTPKKGGTLIFGRGGDSVGLDPAARTDGESLNVTDLIFDGLLTLKSGTTEVIPSLATDWTISKDAKTYTFNLRTDAKFHDGTPVDADAVLFSFLRQKDPKHPAHGFVKSFDYFTALGFEKLITDVKKVDADTVAFVLTSPDATFLSTLAMQSFAIVSPTAVMRLKSDFQNNPIGSGPFVFKRWEKNQKIILTANDNYWGGRPYVDQVIVRCIPDNSTRLLEMLAGKIHVMDNPSPDDIGVLETKLKGKVSFGKMPGLNVGYLAMNHEKKPFDQVKVRQAVAHAINKKAIVDAVYAGYGQAAVNPMPPTLWGYNDRVGTYDYNPEKAKQLLKEAGFPNGFETTIYAMPVPRPYMPNGRKVAEAIQGDLGKVGIKVKIISYEWGTYLEKTGNGEHDMALLGWTGDIGDPDNFLYVLLDKDNAVKPAQNISFYKSDKLHEILVQAKRESDQKKRAELYVKAQSIIFDDAAIIPIAHSVVVLPYVSNLQDLVMDPTGRRRFAKVWFE